MQDVAKQHNEHNIFIANDETEKYRGREMKSNLRKHITCQCHGVGTKEYPAETNKVEGDEHTRDFEKAGIRNFETTAFVGVITNKIFLDEFINPQRHTM